MADGAAGVEPMFADEMLADHSQWLDIQDLLDTAATSDVVLVPSGADGGTTARHTLRYRAKRNRTSERILVVALL